MQEATRAVSEHIDQELQKVVREFEKPPYASLPETYRDAIAAYLQRKGKRLRPALFILAYAGYAQRQAPRIYTAAVALELLHNFVLIHDDIIDRARVRHNGPAMHTLFEEELAKLPKSRFSAETLAMVVGDMVYALGIQLFLAVEEDAARKTAALEYLTRAAIFTACGEIRELADTLEPIERVTPQSILETCRLKTAYYSFACPMVTGALLAGAGSGDVDGLVKVGLSLGLAYQIRDDLMELTHPGASDNGDGEFADLRDGKRTLPLWYALNNGTRRDRARLLAILDGGKASRRDLRTARDIILRNGGAEYAGKEIHRCLEEGRSVLDGLAMSARGRDALWQHSSQFFQQPHLS